MGKSWEGIIVSTSRRYVDLLTAEGEVVRGRLPANAEAVVTGDHAACKEEGGSVILSSVEERENLLYRSYRKRTKALAANLDRVFIVAAVGPLFNTAFIDRVGVAAHCEDIPYTLVVNKIDLPIDEVKELIKIYEQVGFNVLLCSAKTGEKIDELWSYLDSEGVSAVALAGVSGVGKSTLLNTLVPEANRRTSEVSDKTGQGRQTTSQAYGYRCQTPAGKSLLVIDLPGIQNFGITHLDKRQVANAFLEFQEPAARCEYIDCYHLAEPDCGVKAALETGEIAECRYNSYVQMVDEIEASKEY